jgi:squalene monooxygenase
MYDISIVGAGIAGASLAAILGKKGFNIALIDRKWDEPDEIIGELLQPGGVKKLEEMGLEQALQGIDAQPINGYAMQLEKEWINLSYYEKDNPIQNSGYGFRYGKFVQSLRKLCLEQEGIDCIHGNVTKLIDDRNRISGVRILDHEGNVKSILAKLTIICQGSLSPLSKSLNKSNIEIKGFMMGLILKECKLPFEQHGHIMLAEPAPILAYPVANNKIRVLIDFPHEHMAPKGAARKQYLLDNILHQMPKQLRSGFKTAVDEGVFKVKPTCILASRPITKEGVLLLGDSLNMRHPITGGGMTVALSDVKALSDRMKQPNDLDNQQILREITYGFYKQRHRDNASINILAFALYNVFKHDILKKACFNYLQQGGVYAFEPMSILSGQSRNRNTLFKHFFAVAAYALIHQNKIRNGSAHSTFLQSVTAFFYSVRILLPLIIDEIPRIYKSQYIK